MNSLPAASRALRLRYQSDSLGRFSANDVIIQEVVLDPKRQQRRAVRVLQALEPQIVFAPRASRIRAFPLSEGCSALAENAWRAMPAAVILTSVSAHAQQRRFVGITVNCSPLSAYRSNASNDESGPQWARHVPTVGHLVTQTWKWQVMSAPPTTK